MTNEKIGIDTLRRKKAAGEKITMLTAYDYPTAQLVDESEIDTILVGDSLANVVLGYPDTVPVTMDEMLHHVKAVRRGVRRALLIADMPFGSYNISAEDAIRNATRFLKEGGAVAVKLEGGGHVADTVRELVKAGIPVCAHLGLTPQTASMLGGYRVQGSNAKDAQKILDHAAGLEQAGAFLMVLECIPSPLAKMITEKLAIPTIGIGAGPDCDGQVLVFHDLLGIRSGFRPRFVRRYAELETNIREAVKTFKDEVLTGRFPTEEHGFPMADEEIKALY